MKKRNVVVVVLVLALLLMGSAYAAWNDSVTVDVTAQSATMNLQIASATVTGSTISQVSDTTASYPTDSASAAITNFIPGETVTLEYTIHNTGSIDVNMVNISLTGTAGATLNDDTEVDWTITQPNAATQTGTMQLNAISATAATIDVADFEIRPYAAPGDDECVLTLEIEINDTSETPYTTAKTTQFQVTPNFTQGS